MGNECSAPAGADPRASAGCLQQVSTQQSQPRSASSSASAGRPLAVQQPNNGKLSPTTTPTGRAATRTVNDLEKVASSASEAAGVALHTDLATENGAAAPGSPRPAAVAPKKSQPAAGKAGLVEHQGKHIKSQRKKKGDDAAGSMEQRADFSMQQPSGQMRVGGKLVTGILGSFTPYPDRIESSFEGPYIRSAIITKVLPDKQGDLVGFCQMDEALSTGRKRGTDARCTGSSQSKPKTNETFFFHGSAVAGGFKWGGPSGSGVIECAGLELRKGDRIGSVVAVSSDKGSKVVRASLLSISTEGQHFRLEQYLTGLTAALQDNDKLDAALLCLGQRCACAAVWNSISDIMVSSQHSSGFLNLVINVLDPLVKYSTCTGSMGRASKKALQNVLSCNICLPPQSPLGWVMQAKRLSKKEVKMRGELVLLLLKAWVMCDKVLHRRLFWVLSEWVKNHPLEASRLLADRPNILIQLLGSTLVQGEDSLRCYSWRELPLHLLRTEMGSLKEHNSTFMLRCVKKGGGSYETFDDYMQTYVSLLRENTFANMRNGLYDFRQGKLDCRDMRIFTGVKVVALSPPSFTTKTAGTVLELQTSSTSAVRGQPPMFGSLLALAPLGNFENAVWATVAGADSSKGTFKMYAELCPGCETSDSQVVARMIRDEGEMAVAESPVFFRAYEPALSVLQNLSEEELPFYDEIVLGRAGSDQPYLEQMYVDGSIAFKPTDSCYNDDLLRMDAPEFVRALDYFSKNPEGARNRMLMGLQVHEFGGVPLLETTMDPSQCDALRSALTRRITLVQGPPGCGKTFVGVRTVRLLASLNSRANGFQQHDDPYALRLGPNIDGPILVVTYKNVALDDFLGECLKIWPTGVARIGGRPQAGSALEHRHISALIRDAKCYRSPAYEQSRRNADEARTRVEAAATRLSQSRFFSAGTLCSEHKEARAILWRFVQSDDTDSKEEREEAMADIESQDSDRMISRARKTIARWLPTEKMVSKFCRQSTSSCSAAPGKTIGSKVNPGSEAAKNLDDLANDRNRYCMFEKTTVSLESSTETDVRLVLELKKPITDVEVYNLLNNDNVRGMDMLDRVRLMHILVRTQFEEALQEYERAMQDYVQCIEQLQCQQTDFQAALLRTMKIVGMTITGAAISRDLIEKLAPRTVLVEEAAEVLEPLLVAALGKWVQRLILIGDNEQLPPQVDTYKLARDYKFDTSLMERLIANKLPLVTLNSQSRMMPEFAKLLSDVYPKLVTSKRVDVAQRLSPPTGFKTSMWFWDVEAEETFDEERRSHINKSEADAVLALVVHLLRSGIKPQKITVLASYNAQVELIRKRVHQVVKVESNSAWPREEFEGNAAVKTLELTKPMPALPHDAFQALLGTVKTFLMLGMLDEALTATNILSKHRAASRSTDVSCDSLKYRERINEMIKQRDHVNAFWNGTGTNIAGDLNDAIQSLQTLQILAVKWMQDCIPAAAAACHLRSGLAEQLSKAPIELQEKQQQLLDRLKQSANSVLFDLRSKENVCVSSIDRYQGSENDIVIISLVRTKGVGFLNMRARRVVAQSRARLGMYFVGSIRNFGQDLHWKKLIAAMQECHRTGKSIQLCCGLHGGCFHLAAKDVNRVLQPGHSICQKQCCQPMGCGLHVCKRPCHGSGIDCHDATLCVEKVDDYCLYGHLISRKCNVSRDDAVCSTCELIAAEVIKREELARKSRDEIERRECQRLIRELQKDVVMRTEIKPSGADAAEFFSVKDRVERYVQAGHGRQVVVTRIERLCNNKLQQKFLEAKINLNSGAAHANLQQLFHGTGKAGIEGIPRTGFNLPQKSEDNMFGRGIYFATDSSKSAQNMYTKGSNTLLLCDVLLGKSCEVPGLTTVHPLSKYVKTSSKGRPYLDVDEERIRNEGFDSVYAPRDSRQNNGVLFDEMIVYNPSQAIPRYIIHFDSSASQHKWVLGEMRGDVTIRKIKKEDIRDSVASRELEEFNKATGHFFNLINSRDVNVKQVDVYDSPDVQAKYEKKKAEFHHAKKPIQEVWVFHGTAHQNIDTICREGFKVGGDEGVPVRNGAAHGRGVYTATGPETPIFYSKASQCTAVILCRTLPGHVVAQEGKGDSWKPKKDWLIFASGDQLLPVYVVHFEGNMR